LAEILADRKRFYEEFERSAFPAETGTGAQSTNRVSKVDNGHLFSKVTALRYPIVVNVGASTRVLSGSRFAGVEIDATLTSSAVNGNPGVSNEAGFSYPFSTHIASLTTATNRQATANSFFAATAPERATAHILTTVVELMRGDIPGILKNYRRALFDYQSKTRSLRYAGNEYLNIQFGWQPLITEYVNAISVLMNIDRMVYAESNRRKRIWDGPSTTSRLDNGLRSLSYDPIPAGTGEKFKVTTGTPDLAHPIRTLSVTKSLVKEDYKFSARYSSLVKPNSRSIGFAEKAEETLRAIGLVDDPSLVWELTPWSWLIDWCANIGTSLVNAHTLSPLSGRHSVDYAYFTTQLTELVEEEISSIVVDDAGWVRNTHTVVRPRSYYSTVSRTRSRATPFGFGTQLGSISAQQLRS
jgi:hypothetical protein